MILNNGMEVNVVNKTVIDNKEFMVCALPNAQYINGVLVKYICLRPKEFKEYCDAVKKESDELLNTGEDNGTVG